MIWPSTPSFKIEISGSTFINETATTIMIKRVENNLSYVVLTVDDYLSSNFVDVFDAFDAIIVSLRYGSDAWSKVFSGVVSSAEPHISQEQGEVLNVGAWGEGKALLDTHCDENYGVESINNSAIDTPKEIIDDLITNHINKEFGGAASGYAIVSEVDNVHAGLSVTHLPSQYLDNFVNVNRVCSLATAFAAATPGVHWFVDPDKNLMVKEIDQNHSSTNWDRYYGGSQANATIEVAQDMILYDFNKNVEEYANSIVLSSMFRKPSEDRWTESGHALWGEGGGGNGLSSSAVAGEFIVGSNSLKHLTDGAVTQTFFPSAKNAGWNLNNIGSPNTVPTLNFYINMSSILADLDIHLYTGVGNSYYYDLDNNMTLASKLYHFSLPVGKYHNYRTDFEWTATGAPDWANINWIEFEWDGVLNDYINVDDLHFSGVVVREARDTSEITANDLHQKVIRNDTAVNDTMIASDDSGTAAQLCYAELLRRSQTPIVGMIQIPMLPDLLPGQTLHIHACKQEDGTFRINKDMRVKDLRHIVNSTAGFTTILNLTDDVTNTHAFGVPNQYTLMKQYAGALAHSEARNLKGGALDNAIPRLSVNY